MNLDPDRRPCADQPSGRRRSCPSTCSAGPRRSASSPTLGIPIVEDAAQAFGAQGVGTTGVISTLQLLPDEEPVRARRRRARSTTRRRRACASASGCCASTARAAKKDFELIGYNSRLDELQAAALRLFLPHVDEWNRLRREAAARYAELGLGRGVRAAEDEPGHVYHVYVVRSPERDRIRAALAASEIASSTYYETPLHLPARAAPVRPGGRRLPRDRARRARESRAAAVGRDRRRRAGTRRLGRKRGRIAWRPFDEIADEPAPDLADRRRRRPDRCRVAARVPAALRLVREDPALLREARELADGARSSSRSSSPSSRRSASTTAGGATSRRATCGAPRGASRSPASPRASSSTSSRPATQLGCRARVAILDWLLLLGLVAGSRLLARTIFERPGARASSRAARR